MLHQQLWLPHYVIFSRLAVLHGGLCVFMLAFAVFVRLKARPLSRLARWLFLVAIYSGLRGLLSYSKALDPLYHPSARTAHLDWAASLMAGLVIVVSLLNWRRLKAEIKANGKHPAD